MSAVKIVAYVPPVATNEYTETVAALLEAPGSAAEITVPVADAPAHHNRFAKAANAAGQGSRKRGEVDNGDGTVTLTLTLGKMRTVKPAAE